MVLPPPCSAMAPFTAARLRRTSLPYVPHGTGRGLGMEGAPGAFGIATAGCRLAHGSIGPDTATSRAAPVPWSACARIEMSSLSPGRRWRAKLPFRTMFTPYNLERGPTRERQDGRPSRSQRAIGLVTLGAVLPGVQRELMALPSAGPGFTLPSSSRSVQLWGSWSTGRPRCLVRTLEGGRPPAPAPKRQCGTRSGAGSEHRTRRPPNRTARGGGGSLWLAAGQGAVTAKDPGLVAQLMKAPEPATGR
jgi:hypothetical protein